MSKGGERYILFFDNEAKGTFFVLRLFLNSPTDSYYLDGTSLVCSNMLFD